MNLKKCMLKTCFVLILMFASVANAGFLDDLTQDLKQSVESATNKIAEDLVRKNESAPETASSQPKAQVKNTVPESAGEQYDGAARVVLPSVNPNRISLKYPKVSENPTTMPVTITLSPPLRPGEVVKVYVDGHLASSVTASGFNIERYAGRVILVGNPIIDVGVFGPQGKLVSSARSEKISVPMYPVVVPPPANIDRRTGKPRPYTSTLDIRKTYVKKKNSGKFRINPEYRHDLAPDDARRIVLATDSGSISLTITGYASKSSFGRGLAIYVDKDPGTVKVSIHKVEPGK